MSIDTRTLKPGDLFFAIKGEASDGHDFVARAFEAGAAAAVISRPRDPSLAAHEPTFAVDDTLRGLERLARAARARSTARFVAVTGSVGKTSAKEMLRVALGRFGATHASAASYNNHWGVPLTLSRLPSAAAFAVIEIGMNHAGEITPLDRHGAAARRAGDDDRAGAYRASRLARRRRRRQGRDLLRPRAGWRRRAQSRCAALRSARRRRAGEKGAGGDLRRRSPLATPN